MLMSPVAPSPPLPYGWLQVRRGRHHRGPLLRAGPRGVPAVPGPGPGQCPPVPPSLLACIWSWGNGALRPPNLGGQPPPPPTPLTAGWRRGTPRPCRGSSPATSWCGSAPCHTPPCRRVPHCQPCCPPVAPRRTPSAANRPLALPLAAQANFSQLYSSRSRTLQSPTV